MAQAAAELLKSSHSLLAGELFVLLVRHHHRHGKAISLHDQMLVGTVDSPEEFAKSPMAL